MYYVRVKYNSCDMAMINLDANKMNFHTPDLHAWFRFLTGCGISGDGQSYQATTELL
jgi:hypothetical protein